MKTYLHINPFRPNPSYSAAEGQASWFSVNIFCRSSLAGEPEKMVHPDPIPFSAALKKTSHILPFTRSLYPPFLVTLTKIRLFFSVCMNIVTVVFFKSVGRSVQNPNNGDNADAVHGDAEVTWPSHNL